MAVVKGSMPVTPPMASALDAWQLSQSTGVLADVISSPAVLYFNCVAAVWNSAVFLKRSSCLRSMFSFVSLAGLLSLTQPSEGWAGVYFDPEPWHATQVISSEVGSTMSVLASTAPAAFLATSRIMGK